MTKTCMSLLFVSVLTLTACDDSYAAEYPRYLTADEIKSAVDYCTSQKVGFTVRTWDDRIIGTGCAWKDKTK